MHYRAADTFLFVDANGRHGMSHLSQKTLAREEALQIRCRFPVVLSCEAVASAEDLMILTIGIALEGFPGIRDRDDFVLGSVHEQHRTGVPRDLLEGIHLKHGAGVCSAQLHGEAAQKIRYITGIKAIEHHVSFARIVRNAQGRIEQNETVNAVSKFLRGQGGDKASLAAAHKGNRQGLKVGLNSPDDCEQVGFFGEDRHVLAFAVTAAADAAPAKVEGDGEQSILGQGRGIVLHRFLCGEKAVTEDNGVLSGAALAVDQTAYGQVTPFGEKRSGFHKLMSPMSP